jgi:hypothetical protein
LGSAAAHRSDENVDDYYHFLQFSAEPVANMSKLKRDKISPSLNHDIHKVLRCALIQAVNGQYIATKIRFSNAICLILRKDARRAHAGAIT